MITVTELSVSSSILLPLCVIFLSICHEHIFIFHLTFFLIYWSLCTRKWHLTGANMIFRTLVILYHSRFSISLHCVCTVSQWVIIFCIISWQVHVLFFPSIFKHFQISTQISEILSFCYIISQDQILSRGSAWGAWRSGHRDLDQEVRKCTGIGKLPSLQSGPYTLTHSFLSLRAQ